MCDSTTCPEHIPDYFGARLWRVKGQSTISLRLTGMVEQLRWCIDSLNGITSYSRKPNNPQPTTWVKYVIDSLCGT